MSEPITFPAVALDLPIPPRDKWEREYLAFLQMLPDLLKTHRGQYVAVHEGQVVGCGDNKMELALQAYAKHGYVPIYVGIVAENPVQRARIPGFRVIGETPTT